MQRTSAGANLMTQTVPTHATQCVLAALKPEGAAKKENARVV